MNVQGLQGLSNEDIRSELERGAKFVIYEYCISLIVITLRRPSDVYFIKAGHSRAAKGLPFTLTSLVLGWWGIPWGFIYTPWVIIANTCGGKDVTEVVAQCIPEFKTPEGRFRDVVSIE